MKLIGDTNKLINLSIWGRKRRRKGKDRKIVLVIGKKRKTIKYKPGVKTIYVKVGSRQTGRSKKSKDVKLKALPPGKRVTARGTVYYEYRRNRSDKSLEKRY